MQNIFKKIETPYIDAQTLLNLLEGYKKPRECILRLVKKGELIRIKNGFYLIADRVTDSPNKNIPYEQIANLLYGPSYVSLEWALSFYGMIPERVFTVTSMTLGKEKEFHTPIGDFSYHRLSPDVYSVGITQKESSDFMSRFLMATPEKALTDLVYKTCKGLDKDQLQLELVESKRIDSQSLRGLDKRHLQEIAKLYKSKSVYYLVDLIGVL